MKSVAPVAFHATLPDYCNVSKENKSNGRKLVLVIQLMEERTAYTYTGESGGVFAGM